MCLNVIVRLNVCGRAKANARCNWGDGWCLCNTILERPLSAFLYGKRGRERGRLKFYMLLMRRTLFLRCESPLMIILAAKMFLLPSFTAWILKAHIITQMCLFVILVLFRNNITPHSWLSLSNFPHKPPITHAKSCCKLQLNTCTALFYNARLY